MLDRIEDVLPKTCHRVMIGGNHEARYEAFKTNHGHKPEVRRLKEFSSWYDEYNLRKRGWDFCDYKKWFIFWKIAYYHGFYTGKQSASKHLHDFGMNVLYGHTHQHLVANKYDNITTRLPIEAESIGTLSKFDLNYLSIPKSDWVHGFSFIYTKPNGIFTKSFVHIIQGKFIVNGKEFG